MALDRYTSTFRSCFRQVSLMVSKRAMASSPPRYGCRRTPGAFARRSAAPARRCCFSARPLLCPASRGAYHLDFYHCGNRLVVWDRNRERKALMQLNLFKEQPDRLGGCHSHSQEDAFSRFLELRFNPRMDHLSLGSLASHGNLGSMYFSRATRLSSIPAPSSGGWARRIAPVFRLAPPTHRAVASSSIACKSTGNSGLRTVWTR